MPKINLSGITPADLKGPGPNLVHMHRSKDDNFQEILGAVGQAGAKWEARSGLAQPGFLLAIRNDFSANSQRPFFTKFGAKT